MMPLTLDNNCCLQVAKETATFLVMPAETASEGFVALVEPSKPVRRQRIDETARQSKH